MYTYNIYVNNNRNNNKYAHMISTSTVKNKSGNN